MAIKNRSVKTMDQAPDTTIDDDAEGLLKITSAQANTVFGNDRSIARTRWRRLASKWHPDHRSDPCAGHVFDHLKKLYEIQAKRLEGTGRANQEILIRGAKTTYRVRYHRHAKIDSGDVYIGRTVMATVFNENAGDLAEQAFERMSKLPYKNDSIRKTMRHALPQKTRMVETEATKVIVIEKDPGCVPLNDVHTFSHDIEPLHVAWMTSAMMNLVCYLEVEGITHQAMDLTNLLVDPGNHSIALYGGWEYAGAQGERWKALPKRSVEIAGGTMREAGVHTVELDQKLVRACTRTLIGKHWGKTPKPMRDFIELPTACNAIDDYARWRDVLEESYGRRRFVELGIDAEDIYAMGE